MYTNAERTGVMKGGGERALEALNSLLNRYSEDRDLRKGLAFSISHSGNIISPVRDSYTHAFVLFALASAFRLTGDQKLFDAVQAITAFIDDRLTDEWAGGLFDCYPNPRAARLQNPVMHMLEAFLALHEAWPDRGFLDRAGTIVHLFRERLFQPESGIIVERYQRDWTAAPAVPGTYFEPGHQFEWAWLLRWYDIVSGTDHELFEDRLWLAACERGMTPDGLCMDEVAIDSRLSKRTHRLWPHTEGIKAAVGRRERGDAGAGAVLTRLLGALNSNFLGRPFPGGWTDRVDPHGNSIVDMVPASTLYHLYSAFKETSRAARKECCSSLDRGRPQTLPL